MHIDRRVFCWKIATGDFICYFTYFHSCVPRSGINSTTGKEAFFFFFTHHVSQGLLLASTLTLEDSSLLIWFPLFKQLVKLVRRLNPLGGCSRHNPPCWRVAGVVNVTCLSSDIQQGCFGLEVLGNFPCWGGKIKKRWRTWGWWYSIHDKYPSIQPSACRVTGSTGANIELETHPGDFVISEKNVDTTIIFTIWGIKYDFPKVAGP